MKTITIIAFLCFGFFATAQVGVGNIDPKSTLDISASSTTSPTNEDGILIPRIDNFPTINPTADQDGMMVFATGNGTPTKGFYYWDNGSATWVSILGTSNTLDGAYDEGGAGLGRIINVDSGSLEFISDGTNDFTTIVTNTNAKSGIEINTSGDIITGPGNTQQSVEINNTINTNASFANNYGIFARMTVNGTVTNGTNAGFRSWFLPAGTAQGSLYGFYSSNQNSGDGTHYGYYNIFNNNGNGTKYGLYSRISGSGSGDKYGVYTSIDASAGGTQYGIYSVVSDPNSYSGYFYGRVSIGSDIVNRYLLPTTDGSAGQVMTTDGAGNVTFQDIVGDGDTQNTLNESYNEGGPGAGRGINAVDGAVEINGEDGFQVVGTFGAGDAISLSGAGTRMFFNPRKAAFRAGRVTGNEWNNANIGNYSFAVGENNTASDISASAFGRSNIVSGIASLASGSSNTVSGADSFAFGQDNNVSGNRSGAFGSQNTVNGSDAFTLGSGNNAPSLGETTVGTYATTYVGSASTFNSSDRIFSVGIGSGSTNRANALTIYKSGRMNINDAYNMPLSDGTAGQVMTTDGVGNVTFQDTAVNTDNQQVDTFGLVGNTLGISLEDDGVPVQTVNLGNLSFNVNNFSLAVSTLSGLYIHGGTGYEKMAFNTIDIDTQGEYLTANSRFRATNDGYYRINATYTTTSNYTTGNYGIAVYKNGTLIKENTFTHVYDAPDGILHRTINCIVQLDALEYVEIYMYSTLSGVLIDQNPSKTYFEVERIR